MKMEMDRQKIMDRIRGEVSRVIATNAITIQKAIQAKLNQGNSSLTAGDASPASAPPANRTGALMRSIQAINTTTEPNKPKWTVGTAAVYARIQEYGGRIHAKKGKFLPVPVGADGRRALRESNGNLRSLNLTLIRTKAGKLLLVKTLSKGERAVKGGERAKGAMTKILFVLKKEVFLPARPYFRPAIAEVSAKLQQNLNAAMRKAGAA